MSDQIFDNGTYGQDGPFTRFLRATFGRLGGLVLFSTGVFLFLSVLTHAPLDPSFNSAADGPAHNIAGLAGAYVSDILMQGIGWGSYGLALGLTAWGVMLISRPERRALMTWPKIISFLFGAILLSFASAALPIPAKWPFATGLGGVLADTLYLPLTAPGVPGWVGGISAFLAFIIAFFAFGFTFGLRFRDGSAVLDAAGLVWATFRVGMDRLIYALQGLRRQNTVPASKVRKTTKQPASPIKRTPKARVKKPKKVKTSHREAREAQLTMPFGGKNTFELPRLDLLSKPLGRTAKIDEDALRQNAELLETVLADFGIKGQIVHVQPGPVVTLYELEPAPGLKSSRVVSLSDDIARSMSAIACRVAVIPGRNVIGIELPNARRETVFLRSLMASGLFERSKAELPLALGETIGGEPFIADLTRMPHLLVAGTTGAGKSVGINSMILSLLYRHGPDQCKFIMIDPKMLELSIYDGIPHLLAPVVTDPKKAVTALRWTVREMESRYQKMSKLGVRNLAGYNARIAEAKAKGEQLKRTVQTGYDKKTGEPVYESEYLDLDHLPFIVVIIDEMADLMMVAGKDIETAVQRLAQMARAAGIHVIMATQRPSVDVITGTIKANFPTRISFQVTSKIDSRTILGEQGAEQLLGQGDMLFMAGGGRVRRLHGPFVSDEEVENIANFLKKQGKPVYLEDITEDTGEDDAESGALFGASTGDDLFDKAVAIIARDRKASTSYLQRRLQIGYNRAATLIERLEEEGIISAANHAGKREILLPGHGDM
ncbi:MAG: cell division protein FtsK [Robiginitomaculum sp.]|nr:MAG: cell division protein FtsK [Robiginitomaculum sp.]